MEATGPEHRGGGSSDSDREKKMTRKPAAFLMTALAASVTAALAQEVPPFTGSVSITGISTDVTSQNRFRFEEFRDLESGVTGGMSLRWQSDAWYHRLFGE